MMQFARSLSSLASLSNPLMASTTNGAPAATVTLTTDWLAFFDTHQIERREPPFGMPAIEPSTEHDVASCVADFAHLAFELPHDYVAFSMQIGPGTLGRARMYARSLQHDSIGSSGQVSDCSSHRFGPCAAMKGSDLRMHTLRYHDTVTRPTYRRVHSVPLERMILFAQDVEHGLWFAWRAAAAGGANDYAVYYLQDDNKAPPPRRLADSFSEFVSHVALGTRMQERRIKRLYMPKERINDDGEEEVDDDEDVEDEAESDDGYDDDDDGDDGRQAAVEHERPPQVFRPFPANTAA